MRIELTRLMAERRAKNRIVSDIRKASIFFPELRDKTVKVGIAKNGGGKAYPSLMKISIDPRKRFYSYNVIGHELMHLIQGCCGIPKGEKACDLWTIARSPLFLDRPPNYLEIPEFMIERWESWKGFVRRKAIEAIGLRQEGLRKYIRWFENDLRKAKPDSPETPVSRTQRDRRSSSVQLPLIFGPSCTAL